jgi:hypothetical protein
MSKLLTKSFYLYIKNILNFCKTLHIKSDYIAERYNQIYANMPGIDIENKNTWPYFINLFGEYHHMNQNMTIML